MGRVRRWSDVEPLEETDLGAAFMQIMQDQLRRSATPRQSDAEFLAEQRAKQAAGKLRNPDQTGALLDRLEQELKMAPR